LKDIENATAYSDKFSKRLKDFMRRLFDKNPMSREKAIVLYEYEYMHEFRTIDVTLKLRKKY
jgi:serine/threonine protein kinase